MQQQPTATCADRLLHPAPHGQPQPRQAGRPALPHRIEAPLLRLHLRQHVLQVVVALDLRKVGVLVGHRAQCCLPPADTLNVHRLAGHHHVEAGLCALIRGEPKAAAPCREPELDLACSTGGGCQAAGKPEACRGAQSAVCSIATNWRAPTHGCTCQGLAGIMTWRSDWSCGLTDASEAWQHRMGGCEQ
jgi:hypothetical protein